VKGAALQCDCVVMLLMIRHVRMVAADILNKQSQTADEGWSSSLGVGRAANNPSL